MSRQEILTDVPETEVKQKVQDYESEGAEVKVEKQPDGNYKVIATFPE